MATATHGGSPPHVSAKMIEQARQRGSPERASQAQREGMAPMRKGTYPPNPSRHDDAHGGHIAAPWQ